MSPPKLTVVPPHRASATRSSRRQRRARSEPPSRLLPQRLSRGRLLLVWSLLMASVIALGTNLYWLQNVRSEQLAAKAQQQQMVYMRPYVPRRPIIDRKGNVLATDRLVYTLYAYPRQFKAAPEEIAAKLAALLDEYDQPNSLAEHLSSGESGVPVSFGLSEEVADRIAALRLDGFELIRQYSRLYPQQELVADVVGYVDLDHHGQAGLEYTQQDLLERSVRTLRLNRAGSGALMPDQLPDGFLDFDELRLQLTLDIRLQRVARLALKQQLDAFDAKRGAAIVLDVRDGSILALACEPTFDPNEYSKFDISLFKNWAVTDLYEPGSTFKPLNVAIALEQGVIDANSTFNDVGRIQIEQWEIANHDYETAGARGQLSITQVLSHSSNVGMVDLVSRMSPQQYYQALQTLRLTQKLDTELPGEGVGQLKALADFTASPVEPATTSFGQGFSLTPLKLAQLHAAIANGGTLVQPHMIHALVDVEGQPIWQPTPQPQPRIFSPETTRIVLENMAAVVQSGSGAAARIPGYQVAGKSGTAQKASPTGGYFTDRKVASFVAILPAEQPRYVVLAVVDEPKGDDAYGTKVAAPIAKALGEALVAIEGIPPNQ
ncbi:MAG: penicillin-binding protein 2 [Spirulinaceae cyanobacterium SM2_1_0]|nr:penicillin-binding protein 2 [Spirulinaceae cyanobacterium SM2_1_0]